MSDPTPNAPTEGGNTPSDPTPGAGDAFKPITSQTDLDRIIGERVRRVESKYADYADLKVQAATAADAQRMAEEKSKEVETVLAEVPAKVAETLRAHLIAVHKISDDDAQLFLTATEPDLLLKQVQRLSERSPNAGTYVSREGTTPTPPADELRTFTRSLFERAAQD